TAVAGAINLSSSRIRKGFHANALVQGGYNTKSQATNIYKYVGQVSNRFFDNKLGLSFTGVAEQSNRSSEILGVGYYNFGNEIDKLLPSSVNLSWNERVNTRRSLNLTLDYDLGDFTRLKFNGIYAWANFSERVQSRSISGLSAGSASENRNFTLDPIDEKKNLHLAFRGETTVPGLNKLQVNYGATYSTRTSESLNRRNWGFTSVIPDSNTQFLEDLADTAVNRTIDPRKIISRFDEGTNLGPQDYRKSGFGIRESISDREEVSANIDLKLPINLGFAEGYVKAGGRYRLTKQTSDQISGSMNMSRQNYQYWYDKFPELVVHPSQDGGDYNHTLEGFEDGQSPVDLLGQQYSLEKLEETSRWWESWSDSVYALGPAKIEELTGGVFQRLSYVQNVRNSFYNNTDVTEEYYAGYIMTELNFGKKFMFLPGVRYERTDADLNGLVAAEPFATALPYYNETVLGTDSSANRTDNFFLPMIHARIKPTDWFYVHLSYTHSINRPSFGQITPNVYADQQDTPGTFETRNPNLKTELWKSFDAQMTFHANKVGLFSVNGFYKTVEDKIWTRSYPRVSSDPVIEPWFQAGDGVDVTLVENHPYDIYLTGAELEWQTAFYYLPKPFNFFTLNVNYTYTQSQTVYNRSYTEQVTVTVEGERPFAQTVRIDEVLEDRMVDQPRHIGNVSLGFENSGFNVWLSYQYNGDNITSINQNNPLRDVIVRDFSRLDLQIQYKFPFKRLPGTLQFLGNFGNLTNFVEGQSFRGDPRPTNEVSYGTNAELGLRYRF
ncbi:MAG: TonB-dependent receptor, partial [Cyclobacteriaceae bacterium]